MSVLDWLLPWESQPQERVDLNPELVNGYGLQDVFLAGRSIGRGITLSGARAVHQFGVGPVHATPTSAFSLGVSFDPAAWSVILAARFDTLGGYAYAIVSDSSLTRGISLNDSDFSPGRLQVYTGSKYHAPSLGLTAGQTSIIGIGWNGATLYFAKDGFVESRAGASLGSGSGWHIKGLAGNLSTFVPSHLGFFSKCLSPDLFAELTRNPNGLFEPQTIWVPVSAGGGATDYPETITEAASSSDASSCIIGYASTASEAGSAADASSNVAALSVIAAEAASAADSASSAYSVTLTVSEAASAGDSVNGTAAGDFAATAVEAASAADLSSAVTALSGAIVEAASAADLASAVSAYLASIAEAASAADAQSASAAGDYLVAIAEAAAAADLAGAVTALQVLIAEAANAADAVSANETGEFVAALIEAAVALDTVAALLGNTALGSLAGSRVPGFPGRSASVQRGNRTAQIQTGGRTAQVQTGRR